MVVGAVQWQLQAARVAGIQGLWDVRGSRGCGM